MEFNRWWERDADEVYWLEVTDRPDLGADLKAPQHKDNGEEYYGYSLITQVRAGDVVFHYHKDERAIVLWSIASGSLWADNIVWGAHGTTARNANIHPYTRPGWYMGLTGSQPLDPPLTLEVLRAAGLSFAAVRNLLAASYGAPLYFPFELSPNRPLRPTQAYLTKLPAAIVRTFPALAAATPKKHSGVRTTRQPPASPSFLPLGTLYRPADEAVAVAARDPFQVDPALVERAQRGHSVTQNTLARYLERRGLEPRSPRPDEPNFDLAWTYQGNVFVVEIKSLTDDNEEKQLRLGLGQVLRYRHMLSSNSRHVRAVLVGEREPADPSWVGLCAELGVFLVWPASLSALAG